jgi:hypothetical protein
LGHTKVRFNVPEELSEQATKTHKKTPMTEKASSDLHRLVFIATRLSNSFDSISSVGA